MYMYNYNYCYYDIAMICDKAVDKGVFGGAEAPLHFLEIFFKNSGFPVPIVYNLM